MGPGNRLPPPLKGSWGDRGRAGRSRAAAHSRSGRPNRPLLQARALRLSPPRDAFLAPLQRARHCRGCSPRRLQARPTSPDALGPVWMGYEFTLQEDPIPVTEQSTPVKLKTSIPGACGPASHREIRRLSGWIPEENASPDDGEVRTLRAGEATGLPGPNALADRHSGSGLQASAPEVLLSRLLSGLLHERYFCPHPSCVVDLR